MANTVLTPNILAKEACMLAFNHDKNGSYWARVPVEDLTVSLGDVSRRRLRPALGRPRDKPDGAGTPVAQERYKRCIGAVYFDGRDIFVRMTTSK
jgi:hypothetical protein